MRKVNVKMPLGKLERIVVKHRPIWVEEISETSSGMVVESTVCLKCGKEWGFHE